MTSVTETTLVNTLEHVEIMVEAAAQTLRLLQQQLATAKALLNNTVASEFHLLAAPITHTNASPRDFSEWQFEGAYYSKGKLPLAVFQQRAGQYTLAELEDLFRSERVYLRPLRGNKTVFKQASQVSRAEDVRFHAPVILTKDKQPIRITNQVGMNNFPQLLGYLANHFGFPLRGRHLNSVLWGQQPILPFATSAVDFA